METTARDIMSTEVLSAQEGMTIEEVLKLLVNNRITGLPVVDAKGKIVGVVSEYDVLQQLSQEKGLKAGAFRKKAKFTRKAEAVLESTSLDEVIRLFVDSRFRRLPVVDRKGHISGIITRRDLMRLFYYRAKLGATDTTRT